jgi:hypothetical protein
VESRPALAGSSAVRFCTTPAGPSETCGDPERNDSDKVLGIAAAMLF